MSRDVKVVEYVSLDGVIQAPGHAAEDTDHGFAHGGWTGPFMAAHRRYMTDALRSAGGFLFGRRTYEIFAGYWPTVTDPADLIAKTLNGLPKYVASTTLMAPTWNHSFVLSDPVADAVADLKRRSGGDLLLIGSGRLAGTLFEHDLVDTYELWLHPVVLGKGKRLFEPGGRRADLRLRDSRTTEEGLVILTYSAAP